MRQPAPAKLNLFLHLTGRRDDGYHLLDSLVAFADVGDGLEAEAAEELSLRITGPFAGTLAGEAVDDNLVMRAARALQQACGVRQGAAMVLDKQLPVASGIGGGSSDAAASLRALARLWRLPVGLEELKKIAAPLGSDLPVCLAAKAMRMRGIGEILTPAPVFPAFHAVLVNPGIPLPTADIYRGCDHSWRKEIALLPAFADVEALAGFLAEHTFNDLEKPARKRCGEIAPVVAALQNEGALLARMSGSGATCFGMFASDAAAQDAAKNIATQYNAWWVKATRVRGADETQ